MILPLNIKKFKGSDYMDKIKMIQEEILAEKEFIFPYENGILLILRKKFEKLYNLKRKIISNHLDKEEKILMEDKYIQVIYYR